MYDLFLVTYANGEEVIIRIQIGGIYKLICLSIFRICKVYIFQMCRNICITADILIPFKICLELYFFLAFLEKERYQAVFLTEFLHCQIDLTGIIRKIELLLDLGRLCCDRLGSCLGSRFRGLGRRRCHAGFHSGGRCCRRCCCIPRLCKGCTRDGVQ